MNNLSKSAHEQNIKAAIAETKELIVHLREEFVILAADIKAQRLVLRNLNADLRKLHPPRVKR